MITTTIPRQQRFVQSALKLEHSIVSHNCVQILKDPLPMHRFKAQGLDSSTSSFIKSLALRGLQPDHRADSSKSRINTTNMESFTCFPGLPQPSDCQPDSDRYRCYLHKLPHIVFSLIDNPSTTSCCMACDDTGPFELHQCTKCGLRLCGLCVYMITDGLIRGDLRRLIEHVARWKVGYSRMFLERERAETARDWKTHGKLKAEAETETEMRWMQKDIDRLFEKIVESFTSEGERKRGGS